MTTSITKLWTAARAMFERVRAAAHIAAQAFSRYEIEHMRARLRPLEALVRKIVLIEAMALANEPARVTRARLTHRTSTMPRPRTYAVRLWPHTPPPPARIRQLGPPPPVRDIFRDHARAAMMRRLSMARATRPPDAELIARRIGALERIFAKPIAAVRRLARKLNAAPKLALKLAVKGWPRSPHADRDAQMESDHAAYAGARHFKPASS